MNKTNTMAGRIGWIDTARGICMLAILLFHTEMYYAEYDVINYNFYVENVLITFFIISGYLFYKDGKFAIGRKIKSIARGIVMPYFIFTTAMALPKAIAHNNFTSVSETILNIISGNASWFVTALAVSEIIFSILLYISERYYAALITPIACIVAAVAAFGIDSDLLLIWNTNVALMALIFIYCGYLFHKYDKQMARYITNKLNLPLLIALILIKWYEYEGGLDMLVWPLRITSFPVFIVDTIMSAILIVNLSKLIPPFRFLSFVGRNSIVYYFLCGGIPLVTSALLRKVGMEYNGNYMMIVVTFIIVCAAATAATWLICRYIPFITGRKNAR